MQRLAGRVMALLACAPQHVAYWYGRELGFGMSMARGEALRYACSSLVGGMLFGVSGLSFVLIYCYRTWYWMNRVWYVHRIHVLLTVAGCTLPPRLPTGAQRPCSLPLQAQPRATACLCVGAPFGARPLPPPLPLPHRPAPDSVTNVRATSRSSAAANFWSYSEVPGNSTGPLFRRADLEGRGGEGGLRGEGVPGPVAWGGGCTWPCGLGGRVCLDLWLRGEDVPGPGPWST